ncbi:MAG: hypothetical protein JXJ17_12090 [Anaerolineae bacterium]|nr:hypothetical protein [Anaerolineae bacterium]
MGGRGSRAPTLPEPLRLPLAPVHQPPPDPDTYQYVAISSRDLTPGGPHYAFLENLGREWTIVTHDLDAIEDVHPYHSFGMAQPTLRWVKDNKVVDLYVDGMTTGDYFAATGLRFHNEIKGPYVLSKRVSRVMRPYFVSGEFDPADVTVRYMEADDYAAFIDSPNLGEKVFDGAGVISRAMLEKMLIRDDLSPPKQAQLRRELAHAGRVEFTIMTERGQDKGHAIVSDNLDVDFLIPHDTKREITLENGRTWVGIDFVHGKDRMRIDIQSLINLHPFFENEQYAQWLHDEGTVFIEAVRSGDVVEPMRRIGQHETLDDVQQWALREFFASGGHPQWFQYHTRSLMNRHLDRLDAAVEGKLRVPIPGGRYYVMPAGVGRAAGVEVDVAPGQIHIDHKRGTAWVSDADWLAFDDSPKGEGIAGILGGADNDDALWLHPFADFDGTRRVLAWRSPNQLGEYVLLEPTPTSRIPEWQTADAESVTFVPGDSRRLPPRVDTLDPDYLGLVDHRTGEALGSGEPYSLAAMDRAIGRALDNQGALGMYCNSLMVNKALTGGLPEKPPAPLEDVIDSSVKTGADLSRVKQWNYDNSIQVLEARQPIPSLLHGRLSYDRESEHRPPPPVPTHDHWLDDIQRTLRSHIKTIEAARDELAAQAMPPQAVFDAAMDDPESIGLGGVLNQAYAKSIRSRAHPDLPPTLDDHEAARQAVEGYLNRYPEEQHTAILRGAMVSAYMGDEASSDNAVWLMGEKREDGSRAPGIAQKSIQALREIGVLDEIGETSLGTIVYPGATVREPAMQSAGITGVWFNWLKTQYAGNGRAVPERMQDIPKPDQRQAKQRIAHLAKTQFPGMRLRVADEGGKLVAYTERRNLFGYLKGAEGVQPGDVIELGISTTKDGNMRVQYWRAEAQGAG